MSRPVEYATSALFSGYDCHIVMIENSIDLSVYTELPYTYESDIRLAYNDNDKHVKYNGKRIFIIMIFDTTHTHRALLRNEILFAFRHIINIANKDRRYKCPNGDIRYFEDEDLEILGKVIETNE